MDQGSNDDFVQRACLRALRGAGECGAPVAALVAHDGILVAEGRNRRQQESNFTLHGETDCLRERGVHVDIIAYEPMKTVLSAWKDRNPAIRNGDIGH